GLTDWRDNPDTVPTTADPMAEQLVQAVAQYLDTEDARWLSAAVAHDAVVVETYTGQHDISNLGVEVNALRYRPVPVTIRVSETSSTAMAQLLRVAFAGIRVQEAVATGEGTGMQPTNTISLPLGALREPTKIFGNTNFRVVFEDADAWLQRAINIADTDPSVGPDRIRLFGRAEAIQTISATSHSPETALYTQPVTSAGRLEMLPFIREQSVTMTAHRFGTLSDLPQLALGDIKYD